MNNNKYPVASLSEKELQNVKSFEQQLNANNQNKDTILIAYTKA